jgi:hypothetical protein
VRARQSHSSVALVRSGGPNFLGSGTTESTIVAGITSFGINGNCAGTGGVFRTDRQDVLDFIGSFLP